MAKKASRRGLGSRDDEDFEDLIEIFGEPRIESVHNLTMGNAPITGSLCDPEGLTGNYRSDFSVSPRGGVRIRTVDKLLK